MARFFGSCCRLYVERGFCSQLLVRADRGVVDYPSDAAANVSRRKNLRVVDWPAYGITSAAFWVRSICRRTHSPISLPIPNKATQFVAHRIRLGAKSTQSTGMAQERPSGCSL